MQHSSATPAGRPTSDSGALEESTPRANGTPFLALGLALLLATAAFFSGVHIGQGNLNPPGQNAGLLSSFFGTGAVSVSSEKADLTEFWRVWELMEEKFVAASTTETITTEARLHGAISGMVESYGDPYSTFLPPVESAQFEENISGNFSGVGMEVGMRDGAVTIIAPLPGTPAEAAGLLPGDVIVEIDGKSTDAMTLDAAVKRIRGEKGTEVVLTIYREGAFELRDVSVVRDTIDIPVIETNQDGDIFLISLYNFNALSEFKMQEALREFVRSDTEKLILDLRGNPGGFLQSAVSISSFFLPAGKVVVREHFGDDVEDEVFRSQGKILRQHTPEDMVVLINGGSASAAEIVAGALREHNVATLIGERTFGKGSVQELVELPNGSSLKVTVARWLTPNGVSISEGGLTPDVEIERSAQQYLEGDDPQIEAAKAWLRGERDFSAFKPKTSSGESFGD